MGMMESLAQLREEAEAKLNSCQSPEDLEQALVDVLGRNGSLTNILRTMGKLAGEERASSAPMPTRSRVRWSRSLRKNAPRLAILPSSADLRRKRWT